METTNILEQVNRDVKGIIAERFEELTLFDTIEDQQEERESEKNCTKRKAVGQIQHRHHKLRRFEFLDDFGVTEDTEALFDDWDWSSDEFDIDEKQPKLTDKEPLGCTKLHLNFYDDSDVKNDWNDFNFWKFSSPALASLKIDIKAEDRIALEEAGAEDLLMECQTEAEAEAQTDSQTLVSSTTSPILLSMKPPRSQLTTKYLWPQGEKRLLYETKKHARTPRKYAKLLLKQP